MTIKFTCKYCNEIWTEQVYSYTRDTVRRCRICQDTNLKAQELSETKIDYYQGSPPDNQDER